MPWPRLLAIDPIGWGPRLEVLRRLNVDVVHVINGSSRPLGFTPAALQAKVDFLQALGLDPAKVVRRCPTVFQYSEARIRGTLSFLDHIGLDGRRVVNNSPTIFNYSVDAKLRPIVQFVTIDMGRDVRELGRYPSCLGLDHIRPWPSPLLMVVCLLC